MAAATLLGVAAVAWWGRSVVEADPRIHVNAPPFVGTWLWTIPNRRFLAPIALALVVIAVGPVVARRLRWTVLLVATGAASLAWTVALAVTDGWGRLSSPLTSRYEYLAVLPEVGGTAPFLATFVDRLSGYPTHVRGHPPGFVIVLSTLERMGLGGARWAAALVLVAAASGAVAVLVAVADVSDRDTARRLAPFLIVVPSAVWTATSGDAFFGGVGAWAVAFGVLATVPARSPRHATMLGLVAGLLFAALAMLSYGLVLLGAIPLVVGLWRRRLGPIVVIASVVAAALLAVGALTGFWWTEGLAATRVEQLAGVAPRRPLNYFVVANLAALVLAVGPAAVGGWAAARRHPASVLMVGAGLAVVVADLSGFSKGEVERIWLPFFPWLVVGAAALRWPRVWLGASAVAAILIQLCLRTPW